MKAGVRPAAVVCAVTLWCASTGRAIADEIWVAPTYQQDVGGRGTRCFSGGADAR